MFFHNEDSLVYQRFIYNEPKACCEHCDEWSVRLGNKWPRKSKIGHSAWQSRGFRDLLPARHTLQSKLWPGDCLSHNHHFLEVGVGVLLFSSIKYTSPPGLVCLAECMVNDLDLISLKL